MIIANLSKKYLETQLHSIRSNFFEPRIECYIADSKKEIKAAQRLRYKVFFAERRKNKLFDLKSFKKDVDQFDRYADHLIITHKNSKFSKTQVIGTYRLLQSKIAQQHCGFYSSEEFDITNMLAAASGSNILELSRSCIDEKFRKKNLLQLMWKEIHKYILANDIKTLFGMASFLEANTENIKVELSYIHKNFLMDQSIRVSALSNRKVAMNTANLENISELSIIKRLPTLVKAYLRLGAKVGDGAVVDPIFKTTDVFIHLPFSSISEAYLKKFI